MTAGGHPFGTWCTCGDTLDRDCGRAGERGASAAAMKAPDGHARSTPRRRPALVRTSQRRRSNNREHSKGGGVQCRHALVVKAALDVTMAVEYVRRGDARLELVAHGGHLLLLHRQAHLCPLLLVLTRHDTQEELQVH